MSPRGLVLSLLLAVSLVLTATARGQNTQAAQNATDNYIAPAGKAPPVAPPLKPGSPLDHLVHDPRYPYPTVGYKEGHTNGPTYWIAHRKIDSFDGQGWGWIRKSDDDWGDGVWIALQETPGLAVAPHRRLTAPSADDDYEYKFWGSMAPYKAYDPRTDELLPVFVLEGYEVIGPEPTPRIRVGPPDRVYHRPSGASSRSDRSIQSDPPAGID